MSALGRVGLAVVASLLALPPAAAAAPPAEIRDGHADIGLAPVGGGWRVQVKDDTTWRDPGDVVLRVGAEARAEVPAGDAYAFLGTPGDPVHLIPQTRRPGVVWLGWNTQHAALTGQPPAAITFLLHDVDGPGDLRVFFDYGGFRPPRVLWDSTAPARPLDVETGVHAHANWAFSTPGEYRVAFTATVTAADGTASDATARLRFLVGDATAGPADPAVPVTASTVAVLAVGGSVLAGVLLLARRTRISRRR